VSGDQRSSQFSLGSEQMGPGFSSDSGVCTFLTRAKSRTAKLAAPRGRDMDFQPMRGGEAPAASGLKSHMIKQLRRWFHEIAQETEN